MPWDTYAGKTDFHTQKPRRFARTSLGGLLKKINFIGVPSGLPSVWRCDALPH
jgi:hypothetical protein